MTLAPSSSTSSSPPPGPPALASSPTTFSIATPLTTTFPPAASLSRDDIQTLLLESTSSTDPTQIQKDEAYFEAFFHCLPQVEQLYQNHITLLNTIEEKAQQNIQLQPAVESLRSETQQLYDRANALQAEWPKVESEMNEMYKRFSPSSLHFLLSQSASKLNDHSEDLANAFVEGLPFQIDENSSEEQVLDDTTFVRKYKAERTLYHRRKLIAERWARGQVHWSD